MSVPSTSTVDSPSAMVGKRNGSATHHELDEGVSIPSGSTLGDEGVGDEQRVEITIAQSVVTGSQRTPTSSSPPTPCSFADEGREVIRAKEAGGHHPQRHRPVLDSRFTFCLGVILINEAIAMMMLLPFVGLLVASFGEGDRSTAGYTSGLIIGIYQFAQIFCAPLWGRHSDRFGRRPVILSGLSVAIVAVLGFGFSKNLYWAMFWRFFHGAASANISVAKSATVEVTTKETEAKGFALLSASWCVGAMVGPAVGGVLYHPCTNHLLSFIHWSEDSLFCEYPALLPCVASACFGTVAITVGFFLFQETNLKAEPFCWENFLYFLQPSYIQSLFSSSPPTAASQTPTGSLGFTAASESSSESSPSNSVSTAPADALPSSTTQQRSSAASPAPSTAPSAAASPLTPAPMAKKMTMKDCWNSTLIRGLFINYMAIAAANIAFNEVLPLWAIAPRSKSGLGLESGDLGIFFTFNGFSGICVTFVFAPLVAKYGRIKLWRYSILGWAVSYLSFPCVGFWRDSESNSTLIGMLCILTVWRTLVANNSFSLSMMFIGNSAPEGCTGSVMGYSQSVAAIARTITPVVFAPLFAWSIAEPRPFPFNYFFVFLVATGILFWPFYSALGLVEEDVFKARSHDDAASAPSADVDEKLEEARGCEDGEGTLKVVSVCPAVGVPTVTEQNGLPAGPAAPGSGVVHVVDPAGRTGHNESSSSQQDEDPLLDDSSSCASSQRSSTRPPSPDAAHTLPPGDS